MKETSKFTMILDGMAFIAGIMLVALVLIICVEIGARYFFQSPQVWTVEVCEYLLFSIAFFGAPWLLKVGGHVNIDIFTNRLGKKKLQVMGCLSTAAGSLVSAIITCVALKVAVESYQSNVLLTKTISVPQYPFILIIALGYLCLFFEFVRQFRSHVKKFKEAGKWSGGDF